MEPELQQQQQQQFDAAVGFMLGHSYLLRSSNSLRGRRRALYGRGGAALIRGEADWIPHSWKTGDKGRDEGEREGGRASDLCGQTRCSIKIVQSVWWVRSQGSKHIQNE